MRSLFYIIAPLVLWTSLAHAGDASHPWLAYGDLRGQIAPCGCDPTTDLGGLGRLARAITETRDKNAATWLFSLGNNLPLDADEAKRRTMIEAEAALNPLVTLLRPVEWRDLAVIAAAREKRHDTRPYYVLSNLIKTTPHVDFTRLAPGLVVMGYSTIPGATRVFDASLAKNWQTFLTRHDKATKVLLFAGEDRELKAIRQTNLFDIIVAGNATPADSVPSPIEKTEPGRLLRAEIVHAVPVFGQGILRGGSLRGMRSLSDLLERCPPGPSCLEKTSLMASGEDLVTWLDRSWDGSNPLDKILEEYRRDTARAFEAQASERKKELANTPFAGSAACQGCHAKEHEIWTRSKHAHAYVSLVAKAQNKDSECVNCHVLGWKDQGGFVDSETSPQFLNVQCESCHGPRLAHIASPTTKVAANAKAVCVTCHQGPHSPKFDFKEYWERIKHP